MDMFYFLHMHRSILKNMYYFLFYCNIQLKSGKKDTYVYFLSFSKILLLNYLNEYISERIFLYIKGNNTYQNCLN